MHYLMMLYQHAVLIVLRDVLIWRGFSLYYDYKSDIWYRKSM